MRYFTIEQHEALRAALTARAALLRETIAGALAGQDGAGLPNRSEETDDDAVVDLQSSLDTTQLSRTTLELREVERGLERWHTPEFGECADCAEAIPFIRLQANPLAIRCLACQAAHEHAHATDIHATL